MYATETRANRAALVAVALSAVGALAALHLLLLTPGALSELSLRAPGADGRPARGRVEERPVDFEGTFQLFDGTPSTLPGNWPGFRGPFRDNIVHDAPPLADSWGADGPPVLWTVELGEGYSGPAVLNGRVYLLDYDETARADTLRCFSLDDGREIWRRAYEVEVRRNHGMSRTVPAVTDRHVVSIGPRCHVLCADAETGDFRWGIDLQREYGTQEPLWYTGQCPLIDGDTVVLAPAGPGALLLGVDLETGAVRWTTPNPMGWSMSHSSVMSMSLAGRRTYVYAASGGIAGVSAEGADMGALLWRVPWDAKIVAPSPVVIGDDRVLALAGYGAGGLIFEVRATAEGFEAEELSRHGTRDGIAAEQHTPIVHEGYLYTIMPKDAGALRAQFACYSADGALVWASGQERRFGLGPWLLADGKFFALGDEGDLYLIRATPGRFELLDYAQALHGHESWAPLALAGDRLLARDLTRMVCLNVGISE